MSRLRGKGSGGVVLASAAHVGPAGEPPPMPARIAAERAKGQRDGVFEPAEVILVSRDLPTALSVRLPWARVIGYVVEEAVEGYSPSAPVLSEVFGAVAATPEDVLLLLDAERGELFIDPEPAVLAAFQAERERIAPRRRLYLGREHEPAVSLDGRTVRVLALAELAEEAERAVAAGADGVVVLAGHAVLRQNDSDEDQLALLSRLADAAAGKPLTVIGNLDMVSAAALLAAAIRADVTLAISAAVGASAQEVTAILAEVAASLREEDVSVGPVRLGLSAEWPADVADAVEGGGFARIVARCPLDRLRADDAAHTWVADLCLLAASSALPVELVCEERDVRLALGLGAAGLIVRCDEARPVKEMVRDLEIGECRAEVGF